MVLISSVLNRSLSGSVVGGMRGKSMGSLKEAGSDGLSNNGNTFCDFDNEFSRGCREIGGAKGPLLWTNHLTERW